jgi:hypothetical protein
MNRMPVGYYVSTPWSRLCADCMMWASLAYHDAMAVGPVAMCHYPRASECGLRTCFAKALKEQIERRANEQTELR